MRTGIPNLSLAPKLSIILQLSVHLWWWVSGYCWWAFIRDPRALPGAKKPRMCKGAPAFKGPSTAGEEGGSSIRETWSWAEHRQQIDGGLGRAWGKDAGRRGLGDVSSGSLGAPWSGAEVLGEGLQVVGTVGRRMLWKLWWKWSSQSYQSLDVVEGAMMTSVLRDHLSTAHLLLCPSISQAQKSEVGVGGTEIGYQLELCRWQNQFLISFKKGRGSPLAHFTESTRYCLQAWLDPGTQVRQWGSLFFTVTICVWVGRHWRASSGAREQTFFKSGWSRHLHHQGQEVLVFLGSRDWGMYVSSESTVTSHSSWQPQAEGPQLLWVRGSLHIEMSGVGEVLTIWMGKS